MSIFTESVEFTSVVALKLFKTVITLHINNIITVNLSLCVYVAS